MIIECYVYFITIKISTPIIHSPAYMLLWLVKPRPQLNPNRSTPCTFLDELGWRKVTEFADRAFFKFKTTAVRVTLYNPPHQCRSHAKKNSQMLLRHRIKPKSLPDVTRSFLFHFISILLPPNHSPLGHTGLLTVPWDRQGYFHIRTIAFAILGLECPSLDNSLVNFPIFCV